MFSKTYGVFNENADYMRLIIIYWHHAVTVSWKALDLIKPHVGQICYLFKNIFHVLHLCNVISTLPNIFNNQSHFLLHKNTFI